MAILKRAADYVLQNPFVTLAIVILTNNVLLFGSVALALVAFVTLRKSVYEGGILMLAGLVSTLMIKIFLGVGILATNTSLLSFLFFDTPILIVWPIAIVLRQTSNWGI